METASSDRVFSQEFMQEKRKQIQRKKYKSSFLEGLFAILQNPENHQIINWNEDGTAFAIIDAKQFADYIAPKYYKHNNISSFLKQLNMYKFQRAGTAKNELTFSHPLFQRDRKDLLQTINRKHVNPTSNKSKEKEGCESLESLTKLEENSSKKLLKLSNDPDPAAAKINCKIEQSQDLPTPNTILNSGLGEKALLNISRNSPLTQSILTQGWMNSSFGYYNNFGVSAPMIGNSGLFYNQSQFGMTDLNQLLLNPLFQASLGNVNMGNYYSPMVSRYMGI